MPTPLKAERLLNQMISRHRRIANQTYKKLIEDTNTKQTSLEDRMFYRGLITDLISMIRELREQEHQKREFLYNELLDEIDSMEGKTYREKVMEFFKSEVKN